MLYKGLLDRMKLSTSGQAFDSRNRFSGNIPDGLNTRLFGAPVHQDGTGAAKAFTTSILGSCQFQVTTQNPEQRPVGFGFQLNYPTVEGKLNHFLHADHHELIARPVCNSARAFDKLASASNILPEARICKF
jgi:hypothetical protein